MLSLLEESNRRNDLRRLMLRRRIDFDRCSAGRVDDDGGGKDASLSLSILSAMCHILLLYWSLFLLLLLWTAVACCRAENGDGGRSSEVIISDLCEVLENARQPQLASDFRCRRFFFFQQLYSSTKFEDSFAMIVASTNGSATAMTLHAVNMTGKGDRKGAVRLIRRNQ